MRLNKSSDDRYQTNVLAPWFHLLPVMRMITKLAEISTSDLHIWTSIRLPIFWFLLWKTFFQQIYSGLVIFNSSIRTVKFRLKRYKFQYEVCLGYQWWHSVETINLSCSLSVSGAICSEENTQFSNNFVPKTIHYCCLKSWSFGVSEGFRLTSPTAAISNKLFSVVSFERKRHYFTRQPNCIALDLIVSGDGLQQKVYIR